jgi:hypothetical protein
VTVEMMNFDMLIFMSSTISIDSDGLTDCCTGSIQSTPKIRFASESAYRKGGVLKFSITFNQPVFASKEFGIGIEFVDETKGELSIWMNLAGNVEPDPFGFT